MIRVMPRLPAEPATRLVLLVAAAAVFVLMVVGGSIAGSYALTLHQISVNHANHVSTEARQEAAQKAQEARQEATACRQFGGLVQSIVRANAQTQHAVSASKSFGQLFSVAVQKYYAQTGCSRYFLVGGG
jgi:hypothetical protein